jgi:DNA repair exonuclease SbcCD ATPase subunit
MRFVHISDIHIRNLKFHDDYRRVFANLYKELDELKPDVVVNCGDVAHTKTQISPEYVGLTSEFVANIARRCERHHIILGNHDMNVMNPERQDALTPIVENLGFPNVHLHKKSGRVPIAPGFNFWVFGMADHKNYPTKEQWREYSQDVNIGLFHGSVSTCMTDTNWRMTHVEHDLSIFDGLDYVFLGDIHKQQFFKDRRIAYAGSLIQQNFGEELDKGFLLWDIRSKTDFDVKPVYLTGSRKFYTIKLRDDLSFPESADVAEGSRVRISPPRSLTLVEQQKIERKAKALFKPHDVITLSATNIGNQKADVVRRRVSVENLRQLDVQERMIQDFLKKRKVKPEIMARILELNKKYQISIQQDDDVPRDINWKIDKLVWSNIFNYGKDNVIDFNQLGGLTGMFAPNGSGKSNLIDIILETCFDSTTKGISKNINLINDNRPNCSAVLSFIANDQEYLIERKIERIKYWQKEVQEEKEWGKTTTSFYAIDSSGEQQALMGDSRSETEHAIRQRLGTSEQFMLTSLLAQWNPVDLISHKETRRKELLYKFLDLDFTEKKCLLAKEESKKHMERLQRLDGDDVKSKMDKLESQKKEITEEIHEADMTLDQRRQQVAELEEDLKKERAKLLVVEKSDFDPLAWEEDAQDLQNAMHELQTERNGHQQEFIRLNTKLAGMSLRSFSIPEYEEKETELKETQKKCDFLCKDLTSKREELECCQNDTSILAEVPCGDQFPTCKFLMNAFSSKLKIPFLQIEIERLQGEIATLTQRENELKHFADELESHRSVLEFKKSVEQDQEKVRLKIQMVELQMSALVTKRAELDKLREGADKKIEALAKNKEIEREITQIESAQNFSKFQISTLDESVREMSKNLGRVEGELKTAQDQYAELQVTQDICTAFELYIDAMGKDGIAYEILLQKIPMINEEVNKILSTVADFGFMIEHDAAEQAIRFYLQYGQYKSRLVELAGGAEKFLVSVALRAALLQISNLPKSNMFIIDEGFGKLDPKNIESIQQMFDYLRSTFDHVLIVSHVDTLRDLVDNVVDITADEDGYAHVEVGGS